MIVVGLTGSFASGKTEVAKFFKRLGARVFDADEAAKKAVEKGRPAYRAIVKMFGRDYLLKNGELDRKKLASHVFNHPRDLKKLNILIHPGVIFESLKLIEQCGTHKGVLVLDVPLLFESKMEGLVDVAVVVSSTEESILHRSVKKGLPRDLAKKILSTQWPLKRKEKQADFVIRNDGSIKDLEKKAKEIFEKISQDSQRITDNR